MEDAKLQQLNTRLQQLLDRTAPYKLYRWLALAGLVLLYATRVFMLKGFYIVSYALAIYNLNLVLGFITPSVDPELEGPVLPQRSDAEYRPFRRRLPEMKFWCVTTTTRISRRYRHSQAGTSCMLAVSSPLHEQCFSTETAAACRQAPTSRCDTESPVHVF
jgi:Rer1 family